MKTFIVQYSIPKEKAAVSDWQEHMTKVKAETDKAAIAKFNRTTKTGTWMILGCWEN